jgi:5-methylcytosine-specific restriction endonuclease McrA
MGKQERDYIRYVRAFPCCGCGAEDVEIHHFMHGDKGTGMKVSDFYTVPLCFRCHRQFHDHGTLPGLSRDRTEAVFYRAMARMLKQWIEVF